MAATSRAAREYLAAPNRLMSAANGIDYAYRDIGDGTPPLVLLQHFRGNLDGWDPALIDALATGRRVVTFDKAGVGGSTGTTPDTTEKTGSDACAAPKGAAGRHGWAAEVIGAVGTPHTTPEAYLEVFFARSASSVQAGREA